MSERDVEGWGFIVGDNKQTIINPLIINERSSGVQVLRFHYTGRAMLMVVYVVVFGRVELLWNRHCCGLGKKYEQRR